MENVRNENLHEERNGGNGDDLGENQEQDAAEDTASNDSES